MRFRYIPVLVALITVAFASDLIENLPGLPSSLQKLTQYSGYVPVDSNNNKHLFYWFIESQGNPATDPLVLWLNGGTICITVQVA